jgi:hypothetical protein
MTINAEQCAQLIAEIKNPQWDREEYKMTTELLWAHETTDPDTGKIIAASDVIRVRLIDYGPVQGSELVALQENHPLHGNINTRIIVDCRDLWTESMERSTR